MRIKNLIWIALLMVILVGAGSVMDAQAFIGTATATPTPIVQHKLTIDNGTKDDLEITLKLKYRKPTYNFYVEAGEEESFLVDQGTYVVDYTICGTAYNWELVLDEPYTLVLYPCKYQPTKMQVRSHLSEEVVLKLYGYEDREVKIQPGIKTKIELYSGNMDYEYEACGGQVFFGELNVAKNGTTQLILHSCEWHLQPARNYAQPNPVKFRIVNHASFPVIMTLIGPESYLVTVNPGVNVFTLISGNYRYSYYQDYRLLTGNMVVTQNGLGVLVVTPSFVMEYVETSDLE